MEARVRLVNPPECLQGQVFRGRVVAHHAQQPSVHRPLVHAEERFKRGRIAELKPVQNVALFVLHPPFPFYPLLRRGIRKGYIQPAFVC